jgi:hypothetical protein
LILCKSFELGIIPNRNISMSPYISHFFNLQKLVNVEGEERLEVEYYRAINTSNHSVKKSEHLVC